MGDQANAVLVFFGDDTGYRSSVFEHVLHHFVIWVNFPRGFQDVPKQCCTLKLFDRLGQAWAEVYTVPRDLVTGCAVCFSKGLHASRDRHRITLFTGYFGTQICEVRHRPLPNDFRQRGQSQRLDLFLIAAYDHVAIHNDPMAWKGTNVRINTRLRRRFESQHVNLQLAICTN